MTPLAHAKRAPFISTRRSRVPLFFLAFDQRYEIRDAHGFKWGQSEQFSFTVIEHLRVQNFSQHFGKFGVYLCLIEHGISGYNGTHGVVYFVLLLCIHTIPFLVG